MIPHAIGGELQQQNDRTYCKKYNHFKNSNVTHIIQKDFKQYKNSKSIYGELLYLICEVDVLNYLLLEKVKNNFDNCSNNL